MAERRGDVAGTGHTEQRDGQVAQRSHDLCAHPFADLGAVFVKGDIADPMEAVFNRPMAPAQAEQASRSRSLEKVRCVARIKRYTSLKSLGVGG